MVSRGLLRLLLHRPGAFMRPFSGAGTCSNGLQVVAWAPQGRQAAFLVVRARSRHPWHPRRTLNTAYLIWLNNRSVLVATLAVLVSVSWYAFAAASRSPICK